MENMGRTVVCDIEADSLTPTRIWCVVCIDWDTQEEFTFHGEELQTKFPAFASTVTKWVGHNFLSYDGPAIGRLLDVRIPLNTIEDTLILSRLETPARQGGHSLDSWGERLGLPKGQWNDFSQYSDEMLEYCRQDCRVTFALRKYLLAQLSGFSAESVSLEHQCQFILNQMGNAGFYLDVDKARQIRQECIDRSLEIEASIHEFFPPRKKLIETYTPRFNKDGNMSTVSNRKLLKYPGDLKELLPNGDYNLYEMQVFNLGSSSQIVERLNDCGWRPSEFTPGGIPRISEHNLATVPEGNGPASRISDYLTYRSRVKVVENWLDYYNPESHCVHASVIGIGASTHRMAHRNPQMGNIPATRSLMGEALRSCWTVSDPDRYCLVGTDIEGIQLRLLAHFMGNADYTYAVASGVKENASDVHSVNMRILQTVVPTVTRDIAKTFIYAMILGAGNAKLGQILGGSSTDGRNAKEAMLKRITGFKSVYDLCESSARRGYMVTIDGRRIAVPSAHYALGIYLQSNEAIVMKKTLVFTRERARHIDWQLRMVVHDEMQSSCIHAQAEELGRLQVKSIIDSGEYFGLRCPLNGTTTIGPDWASTH